MVETAKRGVFVLVPPEWGVPQSIPAPQHLSDSQKLNLWQGCGDLLVHPPADLQEPVLGLRLSAHSSSQRARPDGRQLFRHRIRLWRRAMPVLQVGHRVIRNLDSPCVAVLCISQGYSVDVRCISHQIEI